MGLVRKFSIFFFFVLAKEARKMCLRYSRKKASFCRLKEQGVQTVEKMRFFPKC